MLTAKNIVKNYGLLPVLRGVRYRDRKRGGGKYSGIIRRRQKHAATHPWYIGQS
jgi:hypothetical protein